MKSVSLMAVLSVLTVNMFLSLFFPAAVSGDVADCGDVTPLLSITTPGTMEALSGSCLLIPCRYNTTDPRYDSSKTIHGVWMKNWWSSPSDDIFRSDGSVNIYNLNMTGNLKYNDCTTLFPDLQTNYSDKYFFRIENGDYKASACADSLQISVKDSAWSPDITISDDLKEGGSVSVTCSAHTPCPDSPPELTWSLQNDSRRTEKNPDGTFTTKIQENIILSDTHDGDTISCSVRYPVDGGKQNKTAGTNVTLSVSYAPKDTSASISPSGVVSAGSWVELSCSSRANPLVRTFTWFRNTKHGPVNVSVGQVYRFNASVEQFYCVALNDLGNQTSPVVLLDVGDAPKNTSASVSPSGVVSAGSWVELNCSSRAKPPVRTFTWFRNASGGPVNVSGDQVYSFRVTKGGEFYCVASNDLGNQTSAVVHLNLSVEGGPPLWKFIVVGPIVLIVLAVFVWRFESKRRAPQPTQDETGENADAQKAADKAEELHYGEVKFTKNRTDPSPVSAEDRGQVEMVYDAVKVPKPEDGPAQAADSPEDLYAQVKKN